jgi:ABC-type phosphate transport system substrate-binding protein
MAHISHSVRSSGGIAGAFRGSITIASTQMPLTTENGNEMETDDSLQFKIRFAPVRMK